MKHKTIQSDDLCIRGVLVYDKRGNELCAYYTKKGVKLIAIDYVYGWEILDEVDEYNQEIDEHNSKIDKENNYSAMIAIAFIVSWVVYFITKYI